MNCLEWSRYQARPAQKGRMTHPIITTEKPNTCPLCESPMVCTSAQDYQCNACGFTCTVFTAQDELDAEADKLVRQRGWNEEHGRGKKISKFQSRW